jgi:carboxyl-terminal processing protease
MNNSEDKKLIYLLIGLPAVILAFLIGMYFGGDHSTTAGEQQAATNSDYVSADKFSPFWKAWEILKEKDVNEASSTDTNKIYGAIEGLAASYNDPYTVFFPPAQSKEFAETIAGNFGGVGMEIGIKAGQLVVVAPLKDSPAMAAGVKTGDAILSINGTSTANMSVDQAVNYIRGPSGTTVKISFLPKDSTKPVDRTITRAIINIPTIDTKDLGNGIFKISLYSFTSQSPELFKNALQQFVLSGDKKLIFDLRGNPGGYLDAAWDMASYFLPAGKVVVTEDFGKNGAPQVYRSKGYNAFPNKVPMVILVDGGSASAAEILAGALHEQGYATLVGTKTFGKGVVQELIPITDDTSLKVTVARWLTPNGHNLSHDGLDPDYKVEITDADRTAGRDTQLEKAKSLLTAQQ